MTTATPSGPDPADLEPAVRSRIPARARLVTGSGLTAGTVLAVLAARHHTTVPGLRGFGALAVTWLLLVALAVVTAEVLRRHHRVMARHARRQSRQGMLWAAGRAGCLGRYLTTWAASRWQHRNQVTRASDPEPAGGDLEARAVTAAAGPGSKVSTQPFTPPPERIPMPDTRVHEYGSPPAGDPHRNRPRTGRYGGSYSAQWRALADATAAYEPDDDGDLLEWMADQIRGVTSYGDALVEVYETCVSGLGVDPAGMAALHDVAEAEADAAAEMAAARKKFAEHYGEVREFAANGGLLAYNGRWHTGEGD